MLKLGINLRKSCPFTLHKDIQGNGGTAPLLLSLSTRWKWVVSLMHQLLYCWYHWTPGCVIPTASLDILEKREISCPCQESNPRSSSLLPKLGKGNKMKQPYTNNIQTNCAVIHNIWTAALSNQLHILLLLLLLLLLQPAPPPIQQQ